MRTSRINALFSGDSIFPGSTLRRRDLGVISPQEVAADTRYGMLPISVVVCIEYKFPFAEPRHQTRYTYDLGKPLVDPRFPSRIAGTWGFKPIGTPEGVTLILIGVEAD
jgi:hypothetical protein